MKKVKEPFYFICYSRQDGEDIALTLADQLAAGPPSISVWLDQRKLQAGIDRYQQVVDALKEKDCQGVLFLMTIDSVDPNCPCTQEWLRALKYKKPIIPLMVHPDAELPFQLEPREPILLTETFDAGLARLREHVRWRSTTEGSLYTMNEQLRDARRDLASASQANKVRIEEEIVELQQQIEALQTVVNNPRAAQDRTQKNIEAGLERERQPEAPVTPKAQNRFINRPPLIPPTYFQDRHVETGLIGDFLRNENMRLITVIGRGGVGKTAMVCRLLRSLEGGKLPDDGGELAVDGIVYLSTRSGHPVNFPSLFYGLCKLVPDKAAKYLDQLYKDPQQSPNTQMQALLAEFPHGRTVVLLDNFEDVVDTETQAIKEGELDGALRAMLEAPPHGLKFIITTRVAPQALLRVQPGLQDSVELDQGLKSPYAENILKAMDTSGTLGLSEPDAPLAEAQKATRGFPRALEAIVGILRTDRSTDLRGLLKELQQLGSKAEDVVRDLVGEAFNRLDPLAQEVMQALAVYGAPVPAVAVDYMLQPYRIGIDSSKTLGRLVNMRFVRGEAGRFYLHQVDRDYALSRLLAGEPADREAEPPPLTQYALRHRAAEYFKETRKPREAWNTLEDLTPQLLEFDLRLACEDYNAAANILIEIDDNYLSLWGHYLLLVRLYEPLQGKVTDRDLRAISTLNLGFVYSRIGQFEQSILCHEKILADSRDQNDKDREADALMSLGAVYIDIGRNAESIEPLQQALARYEEVGDKGGQSAAHSNLASSFTRSGRYVEALEEYELAISIEQEIENKGGECTDTYNLAIVYFDLGENAKASLMAKDAQRLAHTLGYRLIECAATILLGNLMTREGRFNDAITMYEEAYTFADNTNSIQMQMSVRNCLALAYLLMGDLPSSHRFAEDAVKYRYPSYYSHTLALGGVVALRQGDTVTAGKAFDFALKEAERHLSGEAKVYSQAYDKALALAGLALCQDSALATASAKAYHNARTINPAPGVIIDQLLILDVLAAVDSDGVLKSVRAAAAGEL